MIRLRGKIISSTSSKHKRQKKSLMKKTFFRLKSIKVLIISILSESLSLTLLALPSAYSTVVSRNPLLDLTEIGLAGAEDSPHPGKGEEPMGRPRRDQSIHEVSSWGKRDQVLRMLKIMCTLCANIAKVTCGSCTLERLESLKHSEPQ